MNMRERILAGFQELAFTVGFHAATVDELSARTGISKRTIYRYFRSKDEMVEAVMSELIATTVKKVDLALASGDNPVEKVVNLVRTVSQNLRVLNPVIIRDIQKYYPHVWSRIEEFRAAKARTIVEMLIRQGHIRETIPEVLITALLASIRDVLNPQFVLENNLTIEKTMVTLFDIFLYGIVPDEARKNYPGNLHITNK
ncbi:MAG: TetR/AcrR family transcriptional regulator [Bacillota bacterium]